VVEEAGLSRFIAIVLVVLAALGAPLSAGAAAGVGSYSTGPVVGSAPGAPMQAPAGWGRAGATLVYGHYRYLAYSNNDNRVSMLIVAYDRAGGIVGQWEKGGARYNHLGTVTVNAATKTVTWTGQGSVSATWSELQVYPTPTVTAPSGPMPVPAGWGRGGSMLSWGGYRYMAFSNNDNRVSMLVVAYDALGNIVAQWEKGGARYNHLGSVIVNSTARTITWTGQGSVSGTWEELFLYSTDVTAPVLSLPGTQTREATGPSGAAVTFSATATDAGDGPTAVTCSPVSGATFGITTTNVGCSATDISGNTATGSFAVVVQDTTPPTFSNVPANVVAEATGPSGRAVTYTAPTASDLVSGARPVTCSPSSGATFGITTTTVTCSASDTRGNSASRTFTVKVQDTTPPTLSGAATTSPNANGWYRGDVTIDWTAADSGSGIAVQPADSVIAGEGSNLSASKTVSDVSGNIRTATVSGIKIDRTAPVTGFSAPTGWSTQGVTVQLSATDSLSGVAATYYSVNGGPSQAGSQIPLSADGIYAIAFASVDLAGNVEATQSIQVKIDATDPTITHTLSPLPNGASWNNVDVTVTFTCDDNLSGIATCTSPVLVSAEGLAQTVTGTAADVAGNSATDTATVNLDKSAPSISASRAPDANAYGWNNTDVTVSFTCNDQLGLSGIAFCPGSVTLSAEAAGQLATGAALDAAGNVASATLSDVNVDKTAPTLSGQATTAPNGSGWYRGDVTVDWTGADALSGLVAEPADTVIADEGDSLSTGATVVDKAGNSTSATVSGIKIDRTAPTTTATAPSEWRNGSVTVTLAATDALSGVAATRFAVNGGAEQTGTEVLLTAEGVHTVSYWSVDVADNAEAAKSVTVRIDLTNPGITSSLSTAANADGWHNADVTVTFDCTDALSGVATCTGSQAVTAEGANQVVDGTAVDAAGNSASASVTINLDETLPTVTYTGNAGSYTVDQTITINCAAADALSGVRSTTCADVSGPAHTFLVGTNSYSATATDKAGNVGSGATTFTVVVTGASLATAIDQLVTDSGIADSLGGQAEGIASASNASSKAGKLQAFENHVNAQRGKKIDPATADLLIKLGKQL
jgi:hypothetical protein